MPGVAAAAPVRRSRAPLAIGVIGGLLVIGGIAVLVLYLTLWRGGGGGGTGDPLALAEKYMAALEAGDVDAYMACFEPDFFSRSDNPLLEDMDVDIRKFLEMGFEFAEIKFDGVKLDLKSEKGDKATVVTTAGTLAMSAMGFDERYDLAEEPMEFRMVKAKGRWYLTEDPMPTAIGPDLDLEDLEDLEDLDLEDLEDLDLEDLLPEDMDLEDLENLTPEELQQWLEYFEDLLPEDMDLEDLADLENMTPEELQQWLEYLENLMRQEGVPLEESTST